MLAIQLVLLAASLVWGAVFLLRGSLVIGCLAWLLAVVCFGRSFLAMDAGPVTVSLDRLVLVLLVIAYLVHRSLGRTDPKPLMLADYLLFALVAWLTLSTLTHDFGRQFFDSTSTPLWNLLAGYGMPLTVYWIIRQARLNERSILYLYGFLVVLGVYLAMTGLFEMTGQWWLVFPRYIADPDVGIHFGRARGPFGNSVRYGLYLSICVFAASMVWRRLPPRWQILSVPLGVLYLVAIFFSYTRSVWLGLSAGILLVAILSVPSRMRPGLLISICVVGTLVSVLNWDKLVFLKREESANYAAISVSNRAAHAYVSWQMFRHRPLTGWGYGQYPNEKLAYLYDHRTDLKLERLRKRLSHNTIMTLLVETGVIGLGLFFALLTSWFRQAVSLWRDPTAPLWVRQHAILVMAALCSYFPQLLFHEVTFRPDINALMFALVGTLVGLRPRPTAEVPVAQCQQCDRQPAPQPAIS